MRNHRNPQDTVSKNHEPDNFRPEDAVESLLAAILRIETIAQIASDAADQLHYPAQPDAQRAFVRMQILVGKAAEEASAALAEGDKLMAALTNHLKARRASREAATAKAPSLLGYRRRPSPRPRRVHRRAGPVRRADLRR